jgi:hypothetical protein
MHALDQSLIQLLTALGGLAIALGAVLVPLIPLVAWVAFWTLAVNWTKLRVVLLQGGWIGLALIAVVAVLVWGTVAPPPTGSHHLLGLTLGNFVGKTVFVTTLVCIMFLCGSVQLSGACGSLCCFDEPAAEPDSHRGGHGDSHDHASTHDHAQPAVSAHH